MTSVGFIYEIITFIHPDLDSHGDRHFIFVSTYHRMKTNKNGMKVIGMDLVWVQVC